MALDLKVMVKNTYNLSVWLVKNILYKAIFDASSDICDAPPPQSTDPQSLVIIKVRKATKIRNQYNQVPHLTQETT